MRLSIDLAPIATTTVFYRLQPFETILDLANNKLVDSQQPKEIENRDRTIKRLMDWSTRIMTMSCFDVGLVVVE